METPPRKYQDAEVYTLRNDNRAGNLHYTKKQARAGNRVENTPRPSGRVIYKEMMEGGRADRKEERPQERKIERKED